MFTNDTEFTNSSNRASTINRLRTAMQQLNDHRGSESMFAESPVFVPSPTSALGIRAHFIKDMCEKHSVEVTTEYLAALGYARAHLIAARDVLHCDGKKKYEAYIKSAQAGLALRFHELPPYYLNIISNTIDIPFRRSSEKDRQEISNALCLIADLVIGYRYRGIKEQFSSYATTIVRGIDTEQLPPMIAALIIEEVTLLVDAAHSTGVLPFANAGITHEEYWRHTSPEEYADVYPDNEIPQEALPIESDDAHSIAQQSLWFGADEYVDDFIISLAAGLMHLRPSNCPF
jgi:hypothetical protein